jgi:hypothetical protein
MPAQRDDQQQSLLRPIRTPAGKRLLSGGGSGICTAAERAQEISIEHNCLHWSITIHYNS